jgi:hypothetical protein
VSAELGDNGLVMGPRWEGMGLRRGRSKDGEPVSKWSCTRTRKPGVGGKFLGALLLGLLT